MCEIHAIDPDELGLQIVYSNSRYRIHRHGLDDRELRLSTARKVSGCAEDQNIEDPEKEESVQTHLRRDESISVVIMYI